MLATSRIRNGYFVMVTACAAMVLAGCSSDEVQFNGKIFDAVGLSDSAKAENRKEPKLVERAPLVVPPSLNRLPQPGSAPSTADALAEVRDYDAQKVVNKEQLERQHAEFCKQNYELPKLRGDALADSVEGPLGLCRTSILSASQKWTSANDE